MAFTNTDIANLTALKSEYFNDPVAIGYAAANGTTATILSLLNDPANNPTNATVSRPIEEVSVYEVAAIIDATEYEALSTFDKEWVKMFINRPEEVSVRHYKNKFLSVFPGGSVSRDAAISLLSKAASRAEELFGVNTVITRADLILARELI